MQRALRRPILLCNALCMTTSIEGQPVPPWDIADRLRKSLRVSDVGVQEMADHLGISRNTVSAWINGRGPVDPERLPRWAELTSFPLQWIENGDTTGSTPPRPPGASVRRHPKERVVHLHAVDNVPRGERELVTVSDDGPEELDWYHRKLAEDAASSSDQPSGEWRHAA